jgi:membrane protein DedA with SNARE-associated domain
MFLSDSQALTLILHYKYAILFPIAFAEGPMIMFLSGVWLHLGYFSLIPLYCTLFLGDWLADFLWYALGYYATGPLLKKYGKFLGVTEEVFQKIEGLFSRHPNKIIFISKVTMGFGFALATLLAAGAVKVPVKRFGLMTFLGGLIWVGLLLSIGYFFGNLYGIINEKFQVISVVAAVAAISTILYGVRRYLRQRLLQSKI